MATPETPAAAAIITPTVPTYRQQWLNCPGSFTTDLTVLDCDFTGRMRFKQFITTSVTDEAVLKSVVGSAIGQWDGSPSEWPKTGRYYGIRLGTSYASTFGRGLAEYGIDYIQHVDPRHIRCDSDPRRSHVQNIHKDTTAFVIDHCSVGARFGHAFIDAVTVRNSTPNGLGIHEPAAGRLIGAYAGTYLTYPWEPSAENKFQQVSLRAGTSLLFTVAGSLWSEFGSTITGFFSRSNYAKPNTTDTQTKKGGGK